MSGRYDRRYYEKHRNDLAAYREAHREEARAKQRISCEERRRWIDETKSFLGCFVCGEDRPWRLVWHHLSPAHKKLNVSAAGVSLASVLEEMERCIVLCANCHLDVHHGKWGAVNIPRR